MKANGRFRAPFAGDMELYYSLMLPAGKGDRNMVRITWLGTAGVLISDAKTGILIDPYVSRFGIGTVALRRRMVPDIALIKEWSRRIGGVSIRAVIVSHSHFDHAADAPFFARETGALLVGSESTRNIGRGAGLGEDRMRLAVPGGVMRFGPFGVRFLESLHGPFLFGRVPCPGDIRKPLTPPATAVDYRVGTVFSLLVNHRAGSILHHGSAGFMPGMYDRIRSDVLLLCIAGRNHTPGYIENVALKTRPKLLIPIHADNFFRPLDGGMSMLPGVALKRFCRDCRAHQTSVRISTLPLGEPVRVLPAVF